MKDTVIVPNEATLQWLLDGDAALRWQTQRDLIGASSAVVERERGAVAREGWGARLLERQDPEGTWAQGLYTPKWTSTTYTMLLLRDLGLDAGNEQARQACTLLLDAGLRTNDGINYGSDHRSETCITGMVLSILSHFQYDDARLQRIAKHLLKEQMDDGGWNCRRDRGATHASMHTTISVLEGLHLFEQLGAGSARAVRTAQRKGREFLLAHRLFRSHRTGTIIASEFTRFVFPPRWHYDVLRALDYFRAVDAPRDERLAEGIAMVRSRQGEDGRWSLEYAYNGKTYFALERLGAPSRWNTLRALRVLRWWDAPGARTPTR
jgi:hypothetical protein